MIYIIFIHRHTILKICFGWYVLRGRIQNMDRGPWTTSWTTPNFLKEIAPVNMKIHQGSGYGKHRLLFIAYVLEDCLVRAGCFGIVPP